MKNILYSIGIIIALIMTFSCTKESNSNSISIYQDKQSVEPEGSTVNVAITSEFSWVLEGEYDWCTPDSKSGTGNGTIIFTVQKNTTYSERAATFQLIPTDGQSKEISIIQKQNDALMIDQDMIFLDSSEQSYSIEVSSNIDYTVEVSSNDWITVTTTKSKALSSSNLTINVKKNPSTLREATITLKGKEGDLSAIIKVSQVCEGAVIKYKTKNGAVAKVKNSFISSTDPHKQTINTQAQLIGNTYSNDQGRLFYDRPIDATEYCLFAKNELVTEVELPQGLLAISPYSFKDCKSLVRIVIPDSATNIDGEAFSGCESLADIILPNKLQSIDREVFGECKKLSTITIPSSVSKICDKAFYKAGITSITIPSSVVELGIYAFWSCESLVSITLPNSINAIPEGCFDHCYALATINIPESITSIGSYAFNECSSLTSITIPKNVTQIGKATYKNCIRVSSVYSYPTNPPSVKADSWGSASKDTPFWQVGKYETGDKTLYVPKGKATVYNNNSVFKELVNNGFTLSSTL